MGGTKWKMKLENLFWKLKLKSSLKLNLKSSNKYKFGTLENGTQNYFKKYFNLKLSKLKKS